MCTVEIHSKIKLITAFFYKAGLWHRGDKATAKELQLKVFYSIYYLSFIMSLIVGGFSSDNSDECIFLIETATMEVILFVKFIFIIWKKNEILQLLN